MGKVLDQITDKEAQFIAQSKVFFVATAPLGAEHHVSVSPKAPGNSCVVLSPHEVAYADLTGSGAETAAHVLQNGRMTLMFCNLERHGAPQILRLFGKANVIPAANVPAILKSKFPEQILSNHGFRAVYHLQVHRISSSCGYSLPQMDFIKYRSTLDEWTEKAGEQGMFDYVTKKNSFSIDGLPSVGLLRPNGPKHVEPVVEDGYIFGRVSDKPTYSIQDGVQQARKLHGKSLWVRNYFGDWTDTLPLVTIMVFLVMTFCAGFIVGQGFEVRF